jgi:arylsulfatase A-like enzyme/Flp pilus assembly protein TadD
VTIRRVFLLALCALGVGCARPTPPPIVIVSIDTLRSDRLPAYGYPNGSTPAIDALAGDSILFERAYSPAPLTLPAHASLFSGLLPPAHGARDNVGFALEALPGTMLAERLQKSGYRTFGAVSAVVLSRKSGIARGFATWNEPDPSSSGSDPAAERPGRLALDAAKAWIGGLATEPERPPLLFLHLYEPHTPYRPPEPFRSRLPDPYDGEIATADSLVGELVAELKARAIYDDALIFLLSDHGEGLGDHGEDEHGLLLYRETIQVPLLVKLPHGLRAKERVSRNVGLVDVLPTILEVLRLPDDSAAPGLSLLAPAVPADRPIFAETVYPAVHFGLSDLAAVVMGDFHLIEGRRSELFDLAADPSELRDVAPLHRRELAEMRRFLGGIDREIAPPQPVDEETQRALGSLGYLGSANLPTERSSLDDPRDHVRRLAPTLRGIRHFHDGEFREAVDVLSRATSESGATPHAWQYLGAAHDALGERDEAAKAYARGSRLAGSASYLAETGALRLLELGRPQAAHDLLQGELARHPENARIRVLLSRALLQIGKVDAARGMADEAIARDAALADGYYQRAVTALARRDGDAALVDLERAAALEPRHVEARKALAMLCFAQGDSTGAQRWLEEVLAIDPADADALADLAKLRAGSVGAG